MFWVLATIHSAQSAARWMCQMQTFVLHNFKAILEIDGWTSLWWASPPGLVGMSYGFFLSTVCSTTADAMKLAIRFHICDHDNNSRYKALIRSWVPQPKIKHHSLQFLLPNDHALWVCLATWGNALSLAQVIFQNHINKEKSALINLRFTSTLYFLFLPGNLFGICPRRQECRYQFVSLGSLCGDHIPPTN